MAQTPTPAASRAPRATLSPAERLRRRVEFERVYQQGSKTPGRFMTVFLLKNGQTVSRLGIAATRKIGGSVERNRAKRQVRAIFRQHKPDLSLDVVVIPRREFLSTGFSSLEAEYLSILSRRATRAPGPVDPGQPGSRAGKPRGARADGPGRASAVAPKSARTSHGSDHSTR